MTGLLSAGSLSVLAPAASDLVTLLCSTGQRADRIRDALVKADRDFGMVCFADAGHQLPAFAIRQAWNDCVRHLRGHEPPDCRMLPPPTGS